MSRRKQSNPKPLLKSDCQETVDDMTVERDTKDFCDSDDPINETSLGEIDNSEQFSSDSVRDNGSPTSPRSTSNNAAAVVVELTNRTQSPTIQTISTVTTTMTTAKNNFHDNAVTVAGAIATSTAPTTIPKLRLNVSLASDPALKPEAKDIKIIRDDDDDDDDIVAAPLASSDDVSSYSKKNLDIADENETALLTTNTAAMNTKNCNTMITGQIPKPLSIDVTGHRLKVFMCHPCGIGFSSHSTLEAHQKYYCSHRQEVDEDISSNNVIASAAAGTDKSSSTGEPLTKSIKTGKQYACTQCSYSADKKVSLNRHMRMHQSSPTPSSNASNGEESSSQQIDRYCSECDIRFSNVKTYRAHKQHYCSSRRTEGQTPPKSDSKKSGSISPQNRSKTPTSVAPPQPFLALPTNPILIIPYSVVRTASLLPGPLTSITSGVANPDTTCFSFENGSLHPIATALNTQISTDSSSVTGIQSTHTNTVTPLLSEKNSRNSNNILKPSSKKEGSSRETVPLDLSIRKSPLSFQRTSFDMMASIGLSSLTSEENKLDIEAMMEGKENLSIVGSGGKLTPEQIVCSPSLPSSPSMSPSPKRRTSPRINAMSTSPPGSNCLETASINANVRPLLPTDLSIKFAEANAIPPLLSKQHIELALKLVNKPNESAPSSPLLNIPPGNSKLVPSIPNVQPQIYVKQGVSKCKECNIVFCKFENYLAHKQHYCSARNQDENEVVKVNTPPAAGNVTESSGPVAAYQQLICAACGIKYTSLDNLRAHQTFYCPKGGEIVTGGNSVNANAQISVGKEKCNKCRIMHDINKQCPITSTQGSSYKCPVCGDVSLNATDSRKHLETHGSVKAFRCSICQYKGNTLRGMRTHIRMHFDKKSSDFNEENYMSCILEEEHVEIQAVSSSKGTSKSNMARHMKLNVGTPVTSPEIREDDIKTQNGDTTNKINLRENITIKEEPTEMHAISSKIKTEPDDNHDTDLNSISSSLTTAAKFSSPPSQPPSTSSFPPLLQSIPTVAKATAQIQPLSAEENAENPSNIQKSNHCDSNNGSSKYCRNCDIKFNYINTYIAHKQFYCKTTNKQQQNEEIKSPPSPVSVSVVQLSPATLDSSNKNKENVEKLL